MRVINDEIKLEYIKKKIRVKIITSTINNEYVFTNSANFSASTIIKFEYDELLFFMNSL